VACLVTLLVPNLRVRRFRDAYFTFLSESSGRTNARVANAGRRAAADFEFLSDEFLNPADFSERIEEENAKEIDSSLNELKPFSASR